MARELGTAAPLTFGHSSTIPDEKSLRIRPSRNRLFCSPYLAPYFYRTVTELWWRLVGNPF